MIASTRFVILVISLSIFLATKEAEGIIRGTYALSGWFKYQVSILRYGQQLCGGTIIGDRYVLTAAHCFDFNNYEDPITVVANVVDLNETTSSSIAVDVEQIYVPTDYRPDLSHLRPLDMNTGDIAVLKLKTSLGLDENSAIRKADLPYTGVTYEGVKAVASGFGYDKIENVTDVDTNEPKQLITSERKLRYTVYNVISDSKCQELYGPVVLSSQHLCGLAARRGEGTCGGDGGGPLVHRNTVIGVVSSSIGACGDEKIPEVYTRVSSYVDFINKAMSDVGSSIVIVPV